MKHDGTVSRRNEIGSRQAGVSSAEGSRDSRGAQQQHPDAHKARCRADGIRHPTEPGHSGHGGGHGTGAEGGKDAA